MHPSLRPMKVYMDETAIRAFHKEHEHKTGGQLREELLKLSKEEMYDYMDFMEQEKIHGWRTALWEASSRSEALSDKIVKLKAQIPEFPTLWANSEEILVKAQDVKWLKIHAEGARKYCPYAPTNSVDGFISQELDKVIAILTRLSTTTEKKGE